VFTAIEHAAVDNELAAPKTELIRKLLELLLQGCIMELKETGELICLSASLFLYMFALHGELCSSIFVSKMLRKCCYFALLTMCISMVCCAT